MWYVKEIARIIVSIGAVGIILTMWYVKNLKKCIYNIFKQVLY
ncbi:hypothetical protein QSE_1866 [Clostridioides difficile P24]|nr:hypothetical protein QSE_1866 [Clostridioides difficile P24]